MDLETWRHQQEECSEGLASRDRVRLRRSALLLSGILVVTAAAWIGGSALLSPGTGTARDASPEPAPATEAPEAEAGELTEVGETTEGRLGAAEEVEEAPGAAERGGSAAAEGAVSPEPPRAGCAPTSTLLAADVDGDGCDDALRYQDGVLESGPARWSVGTAGDEVALGDWWCLGRKTLAVLRPSTGEVYAFAGWADPGADLTVGPAGRVEGATALRAADLDGDGCHELMVARGDGAPVVVPVPPAKERP